MLLRDVVRIDVVDNRISEEGLKQIDYLNAKFKKKILELNKPLKMVKLLTGEGDMGTQTFIGLQVELEE